MNQEIKMNVTHMDMGEHNLIIIILNKVECSDRTIEHYFQIHLHKHTRTHEQTHTHFSPHKDPL